MYSEWIMDTCMAESLNCSSETVTTLLIGCTPMQNKKLKKCFAKTLQGAQDFLGHKPLVSLHDSAINLSLLPHPPPKKGSANIIGSPQ